MQLPHSSSDTNRCDCATKPKCPFTRRVIRFVVFTQVHEIRFPRLRLRASSGDARCNTLLPVLREYMHLNEEFPQKRFKNCKQKLSAWQYSKFSTWRKSPNKLFIFQRLYKEDTGGQLSCNVIREMEKSMQLLISRLWHPPSLQQKLLQKWRFSRGRNNKGRQL